MSIRIAGTGSYLPKRILTNADLEKMVETSDEWIRSRTGIVDRHIAEPEESASSMAKIAVERALEAAGRPASDIDLIIVASTTPDYIFPNTGCCLQHLIGAQKAFCFDLSAACSGFIYGLSVASSMLKANRKYRYAVVCGSEKLSQSIDWNDRNTCVLFGDGAGAVLLERVEDGRDDDPLPSATLASDGNYEDTLIIPAGGSRLPITPELIAQHQNCIQMKGKETFKFAVNCMVASSRQILEETGYTTDDLDLVIPHQANRRITEAVAVRLGVAPEIVVDNIDRCANTSSATIGIALDEVARSGRMKRGDLVLLTAFGSGLTWGSMLFRY